MRFFSASSSCSRRARDDVEAEVQEVPEDLVQIHPLRPADVDVAFGRLEAGQVHHEAGLQHRVLEQVGHHHLLVGVLLQLEKDPDVVGRDVLDVEERRQLAAGGDLADLLDERRLVDGVGDAGDVDDLRGLRRRAFLPRAAQANRAGSGLVDLLQLLGGIEDLAAGRKVRRLDVAAQLHRGQVGVVEQLDERRAHLAEVVRRDVGRHADGDAGGAVDEQVGNPRRQHHRLGARAVVVRPERHRRLVDLAQHLVAEARETALGVAHRRGGIAVERAEVAGAVDQRVAQREGLRHADERFVERRVAVRVVVAHHVADHLGALAVLGVGGEVLLPHRVEDAALHRLQPVADVGQGARGDDRERVVEISGLRRLVQRDAFGDAAARRGRIDDIAVAIEQRAGFGFAFGHGRSRIAGGRRGREITVHEVREQRQRDHGSHWEQRSQRRERRRGDGAAGPQGRRARVERDPESQTTPALWSLVLADL